MNSSDEKSRQTIVLPAKLNELGEFGLIDSLVKTLSQSWPASYVGPGDDCAVVPLGGFAATNLLCTTDSAVENVHFRLNHSSAHDLGWKVLAVSLSDIAAVGGVPHLALLNLQLYPDLERCWIEEFYQGIGQIADQFSVKIVGGDTVSASELAFTSTVIGFSSSEPILRSTAKEGDDIWVSGTIGEAALGLAILENTLQTELLAGAQEVSLSRYRRPIPRVALGQVLSGEKLAHCMIDISDGLIQDLGHLARASNLIFEIDLASLPVNPALKKDTKSVLFGATGGEDYELLFTAAPSSASRLRALSGEMSGGVIFPSLTRIGRVSRIASGLSDSEQSDGVAERIYIRTLSGVTSGAQELLKESGLKSGGFSHF